MGMPDYDETFSANKAIEELYDMDRLGIKVPTDAQDFYGSSQELAKYLHSKIKEN